MSQITIALLVLCCIVIIILIVLGTQSIVKQNQLEVCESWPSSWCFNDWKCLDPKNSNNAIPMSQLTLFGLSGTNLRCSNLNETTVKEFTYSDGTTTFVKYPEYEVNIWSLGCDPQILGNCPYYTVGDVYWPACSGSPSSKYYTDPKVYEKLAREALIRKNQAEKK